MAMISTVHIETAGRGMSTLLKKGYATPPFKIVNVTTGKIAPLLELMLMSASPGILDEDEYTFNIYLAANTALYLKTQSYQRLFCMKKGAKQKMNVILEPGASLTYLPHPTVPHASSIFLSENKIYLTAGCQLTWGEVVTSGRKLNGEEFLFSRYQNLTEIFLHDKLIIRENLVLEPAIHPVHTIGKLEAYTHQASMVYLQEKVEVKKTVPLIHEWLMSQENTCCGISAAPVNGIVIRMLGYKAEQLHFCLEYIYKHFLQKKEAPIESVVK